MTKTSRFFAGCALSALCLGLPVGSALAEEAPTTQEEPTITEVPEIPADDSALTEESLLNDNQPEADRQLPLDELRKFAEVFDRIKRAYVEKVDDKTLLNNAIKGMLSGLDPHSAYLEPSAFDELQESTSGQFGGLGIEVGMEDGFVKVISPIDDTPA